MKSILVQVYKLLLQPTVHLQNTGLDIVTSSTATWQQRFGAGLILNSFSLISKSNSLTASPPGMTSYEIPVLRKCKTLVAIIPVRIKPSLAALLLKSY